MFSIPAHLEEYVYFTIKKFEHDFGWYREVIIKYDDNNDGAADFAYNVEENLPEHWDDESKLALNTQSESLTTN